MPIQFIFKGIQEKHRNDVAFIVTVEHCCLYNNTGGGIFARRLKGDGRERVVATHALPPTPSHE